MNEHIEVLRGLLNYPGLREYVGRIIYDKAVAAVDAMGEQRETVYEARQDGYELGLMTAPQQPVVKSEGVTEEVLREVLRRVAADADGLLVLAKIARDEAGRLRELVTPMIATAPKPVEGER